MPIIRTTGGAPTTPPVGLQRPPPPPPETGLMTAKNAAMEIRDWVNTGREVLSLLKEAQPLIEIMRPQPVIVDPAPSPVEAPRVVDRVVVEKKQARPAPAPDDEEKDAALRGEADQIIGRMDAATIRKGFFMAGPFAFAEHPETGKYFFETHLDETNALLAHATDEEARNIARELVASLRGNTLRIAKDGLATLLKEAERERESN